MSRHPSRGRRAWPPRVWPRPGPSPSPDACFLVHKKTVAGPLPCCWARAGRRGRKFLELQTPPSEGRGSGLGSAAASPGKEVLGPTAPPLTQLARHRKLPPPAPHLGPGSPRRSEPSYPPEVAWLRMAELGRPSEARCPADPAESQRTSDLPQRASGRWLPARLRGPRRPLCLPEPPLPFPALNTQHKHTRPGGYGEGPTIPDVEGLAHGASGEFAAVAVTTCPLQGAPSARPRSRRTQGDAASGSPLPTVPSVEESAQEGPTPPVWGSPSDGAGGWDPWPPPSAVRQECAHEARRGVHGLRATAWVRIPPPLRGRLQWAGHEDHTGPESCHCALTSPPPAAPWAAAGEETGSRAPRERVRAGPAPGILTPGPVAGRQEVGKPASTNFNTTGHVTDWSPHAAAPGRAPDALCTQPAVRHAAGLSPGLGSRLPSHSHPRHQALSSGTQKIGVGPLQRCEAAPHSLLPTPGPGYRPVRGVRGRKRAAGSARSLGAEA